MTRLSPPFDCGSSFTDMSLCDNSAELGDDSEVAPQLATLFLVEANDAVDGLHTPDLSSQGVSLSHNLGRTPLGLNARDNGLPVLGCVLKALVESGAAWRRRIAGLSRVSKRRRGWWRFARVPE